MRARPIRLAGGRGTIGRDLLGQLRGLAELRGDPRPGAAPACVLAGVALGAAYAGLWVLRFL